MDNLGSIRSIKRLMSGSISLPFKATKIKLSEIESLPWSTEKFVSETASLDQKQEKSPAGIYFPTNIKYEVSGHNESTLDTYRTIAGKYFVLWIVDVNGDQVLIGSRQNPLLLTIKKAIKPARPTSRPGLSITFSGDQLQLPIAII